MKQDVLVTRNFSQKWIKKLEDHSNITLWDNDSVADRKWLINNVKNKDGALVMLTDRIDRDFIEAGSELKAISTMSVGYDHIDVGLAKERGIIVSNTPDVLTDSTADLGFALLLGVARRIVEGDRKVRSLNWKEKWNPNFMTGIEVTGKTLGIYGMGRIGSAVADRAAAFGMKVIYNSRSPKEIPNARYEKFEDLLAKSDFLMVTVSLNNETKHSINRESLSLMKPGSILVNISRGPVVDERALYEALKAGSLSGAGLDVFEKEPIEPENPLMSLENVVLSPHLGSATDETRDKMAELAVNNLIDALSGKKPKYTVD